MARIGSPRKLKPSEIQRIRKIQRRAKKEDTGRVDVDPVVTPEIIEDLEREQQREQLAKITPRLERPPAEIAYKQAQEARRLAEQSEEILTQQTMVYEANVAEAEEQLEMIRASPRSYTIDGERVTGKKIMELQSNLDEYKQTFGQYQGEALEKSVELREYSSSVLQQVGDWSRRVVEGNQRASDEKRQFNSALMDQSGFGTQMEETPRGTQVQGVVITGIPGPAVGPRPGTFGARIQSEFGVPAARVVKRTFEEIEKPFRAVTQPVRAYSERLIGEAVAEPSLARVPQYLGGVGLSVAAQAIDVATIPYRPGLILESAIGAGRLATDKSTREALVGKIKKDPFRFTAETLGGAAIGAKLGEVSTTLIRERGPVIRALRAGATPRQALAVAQRKTAQVDFNKLIEDELRFRYPEELVQPELFDVYTKYKTPKLKTEYQKIFDPYDFRITSQRGEFTGIGREGTLIGTGSELYNIPITVPEKFTVPTTLYRFRRVPLTIPSGAPGIPIPEYITRISQTRIPLTETLTSLGIQVPKPQITRQRVPQIQRARTLEKNLERFRNFTETTLKQFQPPKVTPTDIQRVEQPQIQRQKRIQIPRIKTPQIPDITTDRQTPQIPLLVPPPRKRKRVIPLEERRRKKKKVKTFRERLAATEKRFDPVKKLRLRL